MPVRFFPKNDDELSDEEIKARADAAQEKYELETGTAVQDEPGIEESYPEDYVPNPASAAKFGAKKVGVGAAAVIGSLIKKGAPVAEKKVVDSAKRTALESGELLSKKGKETLQELIQTNAAKPYWKQVPKEDLVRQARRAQIKESPGLIYEKGGKVIKEAPKKQMSSEEFFELLDKGPK